MVRVGAVTDVTIRNNEFRYPCMSSLYEVLRRNHKYLSGNTEPDPAYPFHRNIRIEGNTFHPFDYPILYAKSVDGLTFSNNKLIRSNEIKPFHKRKAGITLDACKQVVIKNNTAEGDVLGKTIVLENMKKNQLKLGKGSFLNFPNRC